MVTSQNIRLINGPQVTSPCDESEGCFRKFFGEIYPPLRYGRAYFPFMDFLSHSAPPPWQPSSSSGPCLSALPEQPHSLCSSSGPPASPPILTPFLRTHTGTHNMHARYITAYVHICSASMYIPPHLCTHILTCLHMHILTDTHTHIFTCVHARMHTVSKLYMHTHTYVCLYVYTCTCQHVCICTHSYACTYVYSYTFTCTYIPT